MSPEEKPGTPRPAEALPSSRPSIGQPFNPYRGACGFYLPDIVGRNTELKLTDGQKRLYERSVRWAGRNGVFWYAFVTIADALGKSVRQVKDDMAVLEAKGLMQHARRRRQSNVYRFLWHPIFQVQPTAHQGSDLEVQDSTLEVQDSVKNGVLEVQSTALESCNSSLNFEEGISSSSERSPVQESATVEPPDDDSPIFLKKTEDALAANVPAVPATTMAPEDQATRIETAREQLRLARAAGLSGIGTILPGAVAEIRPPDKAITIQILECFAEHHDFEAWLNDSIHRGVARKAKDSRWGLYLADAKNHAEDVALRRRAEEKSRIDAEIARQRQQAAEAEAAAEAVRIMNTPRPALEAFAKIQTRIPAIPSPLKARLERTGELISPNELERQAGNWKRCPECHKGILGNALDQDLRFCACPAGDEAQHPPTDSELTKSAEGRFHKGGDYPEREIARVHATPRALLAAACYSLNLLFAGDALQRAEVSDDGATLTIMLAVRGDRLAVRPVDLEKALVRIQRKRAIKIITPDADKPAPPARSEAVAPNRPPFTQADIDRELAKRRQPVPIQLGQAGPVRWNLAASGGVQ